MDTALFVWSFSLLEYEDICSQCQFSLGVSSLQIVPGISKGSMHLFTHNTRFTSSEETIQSSVITWTAGPSVLMRCRAGPTTTGSTSASFYLLTFFRAVKSRVVCPWWMGQAALNFTSGNWDICIKIKKNKDSKCWNWLFKDIAVTLEIGCLGTLLSLFRNSGECLWRLPEL